MFAPVQVEDHTLHVFLADFGLGKIMTTTRVFGTATMSAGTPGFQSPEQLKGEGLGTSSDVYAMGGVLMELFGENAPVGEPGMSCHHVQSWSGGCNAKHKSPVARNQKYCGTLSLSSNA